MFFSPSNPVHRSTIPSQLPKQDYFHARRCLQRLTALPPNFRSKQASGRGAGRSNRGGGRSGGRGSGGGGSEPVLLLNVWGAPRGATAKSNSSGSGDGGASPTSADAAAAAAAAAGAVLLGSTAVHLGELPYLQQLQGWWHILDGSSGQRSGQLKVVVQPNQELQRQLAEVATAATGVAEGAAEARTSRNPAAAPLLETTTNPPRQLRQEAPAEIGSGCASDDDDGMAPFDARQSGFAWSGSDSDGGAAALVGVAVEGAVSPGFSGDDDGDNCGDAVPVPRWGR